MATVEPISGNWAEVTVIIHTDGPLALAHVGNFLQRLDTASRYVARRRGLETRVEIVDLSTSSIKLKYKLIGVVISGGMLALGVADYFKTNPAAVRAGHDIVHNDNGSHITIQGGQNKFVLGPDELPDVSMFSAAAKSTQKNPKPGTLPEIIPGPHEGILKRIDGQYWVQLDQWPGLILEVRDVRSTPTLLQENSRYTFEGDAIVAAPHEPSAFVLKDAILLQ